MLLEVPDEVLAALRVPESRAQDELRREFAVFLVRGGLLPLSKARLLAGLERLEFEDLLSRRRVPWPGSIEDVLADAAEAER